MCISVLIALFRVDFSENIGLGHAMRCFSLSQQLQKSGFDIVWGSSNYSKDFLSILESQNITFNRLNHERGSLNDAKITRELAERNSASLIVLDGYCFDREYQCLISNINTPILLIDDYAQIEEYSTDLILDQNVGVTEDYYSSCKSSTSLLLGTNYVLLREQFRNITPPNKEKKQIENLLITMGGSNDPARYNRVLSWLEGHKEVTSKLTIRIITGDDKTADKLSRNVFDDNVFKIYGSVNEMSEMIHWADGSVCSASSTCYELAYMNVPMLTIVFSENQKELALNLDQTGASKHLGSFDEITGAELLETLTETLLNENRFNNMKKATRKLVDGKGTERVTEEIKNRLIT